MVLRGVRRDDATVLLDPAAAGVTVMVLWSVTAHAAGEERRMCRSVDGGGVAVKTVSGRDQAAVPAGQVAVVRLGDRAPRGRPSSLNRGAWLWCRDGAAV